MRSVILLALSALALHAQSTAGRLSGNVTDPTAAAVPAVRVTATNTETGLKVVETTNAEGSFVLYPLPPGVYNVSAQKDGFATLTLDAVTIDVAQSLVRN